MEPRILCRRAREGRALERGAGFATSMRHEFVHIVMQNEQGSLDVGEWWLDTTQESCCFALAP